MNERELQKQEVEHAAKGEILRAARDEVQRRKMWWCYNCEKRTPINNITATQEHWYVSPHGCTGGDYWKDSDEYWVICPKCSETSRICDTFVQIRSISPMQHFNDTQTFKLIDKNTQYLAEKLNWYPQGAENGLGCITQAIVDRLRKEK